MNNIDVFYGIRESEFKIIETKFKNKILQLITH
jgi:hypothetical protein